MNIQYTSKERFCLWCLAAIGFFSLNFVFIYELIFNQEAIFAAMNNPVSLTFICESFLLMGALAYLLTKWGVSKLHWSWFIVLSLLGSMAFALPVVLLWPRLKPAGRS